MVEYSRFASLNGRRGRKTPVVDADFVHFVGLKRLDMSYCTGITDAAFVHLKGIHTLDMGCCWQNDVTDAAFVHLKGIHNLKMSWCVYKRPSRMPILCTLREFTV